MLGGDSGVLACQNRPAISVTDREDAVAMEIVLFPTVIFLLFWSRWFGSINETTSAGYDKCL